MVRKGRCFKIYEKFTIPGGVIDKFMEFYAIICTHCQFGYKKGSLLRLTPARAVAKPVFDLDQASLPHNRRKKGYSGVKLGEKSPPKSFFTVVTESAA
jgi:hypothetical protein